MISIGWSIFQLYASFDLRCAFLLEGMAGVWVYRVELVLDVYGGEDRDPSELLASAGAFDATGFLQQTQSAPIMSWLIIV